MAVIVYSSSPSTLRNCIYSAIAQGKIQTWEVDSDGDITVRNLNWNRKAWFQIQLHEVAGLLTFGLIPSKNYILTNELYGVYHGRILSTLLAHFDFMINKVEASSQLDYRYDRPSI